jgi:hypothetical protein
MHKEALMKSVIYGGLALVFVLGLAGIAAAQVPWKTGDPPKTDGAATPAAPAPGAPAAGVTPPTEGSTGGTPAPAGGANLKVERAAAPVKKILAQVETAQKLVEEEMAKPADKQNLVKLRGLKENVARLYLNAAQAAKAQSGAFKGEEKQAFLDQYDKPNREKAISLILELANEALAKKDFRGAESLARQALTLDPKNTEVEPLLKKIAEDKAASAKGPAKTDNKTDNKKDKK